MSFQLPQGFKPAAPPAQGQQGGGDNGEAQEKLRQQEEMKRGMIASMLSTAARERCTFSLKDGWELIVVSRIALTRPEMSSRVEDLLVRMGQAGQIRGQVTDDQLKGLLQQVSRAE
jgi:programmed cell death protein 5